jgi:TonB family protein
MDKLIRAFRIDRLSLPLPGGTQRITRPIASFLVLIGVICHNPAFALDPDVLTLNNEGVRALNRSDFPFAFEKFRQAVRLDNSYLLAKQNWGIGYNNLGLSLRQKSSARSLQYFHDAYFIDPSNETTMQNINGMLVMLGKDPKSFHDRAIFASEYEFAGDYKSAIVELWCALSINYDKELARELDELCGKVEMQDLLIANYFHSDPDAEKKIMAELQRKIKENLDPPRPRKSSKNVVLFKVLPDGQVSNLSIESSSGSKECDAASLEAIRKAAPFFSSVFKPLRAIDVRFSFDFDSAPESIVGTNRTGSDTKAELVPEPSEADDKFAPYMHALQPTIRSHWAPPHAETSYKVILEFKIRRTGDVSNLGIFLSSGSAEADAAALQAVKDSVPLPPLPKNEPDADIQFTFDYNYFSHQYTVRDIEIVKSWHGFRSGVLPIIRM